MKDIMLNGLIKNGEKYINANEYKKYLIICKENWSKKNLLTDNMCEIMDFLINGIDMFMINGGEK